MGTLNAAPNQNPFAFECKAHYRTAQLNFHVVLQKVANWGAIIAGTQMKEASSGRLTTNTAPYSPVFHTWQPNANCPTSSKAWKNALSNARFTTFATTNRHWISCRIA